MIKLISSTFYREKETKMALARFIASAPKLSFGEQCETFEKNFAAYQGRKDCVLFNSGSSANLALIQALMNLNRLSKGARVGFSAVTWATNVMPLVQLGLEPVPIDVELETLNVGSRQLEQVLKKTKLQAFFLTDLLGLCADIDAIAKLCKDNGILLIEDNCESLGTVYKNKKLGNFGHASTFSFYVGHQFSTVEGGAVCTDDPELSRMLRLVRAHGWDRNLSKSDQKRLRTANRVGNFYGAFTFYTLGYNLRPTEIQGFLGNYQLKFLDEILKKRNNNFLHLAKFLYAKNSDFMPIAYEHIDFLASFSIPLIAKSKKIFDKAVRAAHGKVEIRPILGGNIVQQPFYKNLVGKNKKYPNADIIHERGFYLGNNPDLTTQDLKNIVQIFS